MSKTTASSTTASGGGSAASGSPWADPNERRIHRRSLAFVLAAAVHQLNQAGSSGSATSLMQHFYGNINILETVGASFTFEFEEKDSSSDASSTSGSGSKRKRHIATSDESKLVCGNITSAMNNIIASGLAISRRQVDRSAILAKTTSIQGTDSLEFVKGRSNITIDCHTVQLSPTSEFIAIAHGYLVSNTSAIKSSDFVIEHFSTPFPHFRLRYCSVDAAGKPSMSPVDEAKVLETSAIRRSWSRQLGFHAMWEINKAIADSKAKSLVQLSESIHDHQISEIAKAVTGGSILKPGDNIKTKLVLIAGPSSSGKTTFAKRLCVSLESLCVRPIVISVDSYYKGWPDIDSRGMQFVDWEALKSLNVDLLNEHLIDLLAGKEVLIPEYDMKTSMPMSTDHWIKTKLPPGGIIIIEGIHCLNPELTSKIERSNKFQIMISPLSAIAIDSLNTLSSSHVRMMRRMVRDFLFRARPAQSTLRQWASVAQGERNNIYPHQNNADIVMNSGLPYEANVLKVYAEPLLLSITPEMPEYAEARRLLSVMDKMVGMPDQLVPPQSLLREFIGGSWFYDFAGWFKTA